MGEIKKKIKQQFELVEAIKANNNLVLRKLYQANYKKVEVYILKNSGSVPLAKDTFQEAFTAVWQNIKADKFTPKNETAVSGYLYQIAKNKWTDYLRSSHFKKTKPMDNHFSFNDPSENMDGNPENEEMKSKMEMSAKAFTLLGDGCKDLLKLFYFEKLSMREIAEIVQLDEASVKNKKYRCIKKLKTLITPNN